MKAVAARAVGNDGLAKQHERLLHNLGEALVHCREVRAKHSAANYLQSSQMDMSREESEDPSAWEEEPIPVNERHDEAACTSSYQAIPHPTVIPHALSAAVGAG